MASINLLLKSPFTFCRLIALWYKLVYASFYFSNLEISGGRRYDRAQQTITMSSTNGIRVIGKVFFKIWNHFTRPIARSTWIRMLATFLVCSTLSLVIWFWSELAGGFPMSTDVASDHFELGNLCLPLWCHLRWGVPKFHFFERCACQVCVLPMLLKQMWSYHLVKFQSAISLYCVSYSLTRSVLAGEGVVAILWIPLCSPKLRASFCIWHGSEVAGKILLHLSLAKTQVVLVHWLKT